MHNLVKSTYDQLVARLQRGGTVVRPGSGNEPVPGVLTFKVAKSGHPIDDSFVLVDVGLWHQKNVYVTHEDKVQVTLSHLAGQQSQFTFFPRTGNCPTLDKVESKIREEVDNRINRDEGDLKRQAELAECERIAAEECPTPEVTGIVRKRLPNGTYEVKASLSGLTPAAVRQILEIERSLDAVFAQVKTEPAPTVPEPQEKFVRKQKARVA